MATSDSISIQMTVYIDPSDAPKFWDAFKPVYEHVIAEPDCTFFEVYQSPEDPGTISWVENWSRSTGWIIENQIIKPYYKEYNDITVPMYLKPREVKVLNRVGVPFTMFKKENGGLRG